MPHKPAEPHVKYGGPPYTLYAETSPQAGFFLRVRPRCLHAGRAAPHFLIIPRPAGSPANSTSLTAALLACYGCNVPSPLTMGGLGDSEARQLWNAEERHSLLDFDRLTFYTKWHSKMWDEVETKNERRIIVAPRSNLVMLWIVVL